MRLPELVARGTLRLLETRSATRAGALGDPRPVAILVVAIAPGTGLAAFLEWRRRNDPPSERNPNGLTPPTKDEWEGGTPTTL